MQLIRETKHLQRMGVAVPESARQVLAQEEKFKIYFNQLTYVLKVFASLVGAQFASQCMPCRYCKSTKRLCDTAFLRATVLDKHSVFLVEFHQRLVVAFLGA